MKMRFFDFEVTPNWWLCVFGDMPDNLDDINESLKQDFYIINSDMPNARDLLIKKLREEGYVVVGYNIKGYDLVIANAIYNAFTPQEVKIVNDLIINPGCAWETKEHMRLQPFAKKKLRGVCYQDLLDDGVGSLKEKEAVLGLDIMESSVDFNKENLTSEDKDDMTYYCKHDVYAAMYFYKKVVSPYTRTKLALGKRFNIDENIVRSSTNAKLVSLALGAHRVSLSDADKVEIELPEKIKKYVYDNVPSKILEHLLTSVEPLSVELFNNSVDYGNGGIHSVYKNNLYVESDDEYTLVNIDATSYYPSVLIQFNCLSRAIQKPELFKFIFDERVRIKHKKDKTAEDEENQLAYKLILNTTFGASGNQYLDAYDPHMCTRTCRLGQIFLSALACKLVKSISSVKIIQSNTDGLLIYVKRKDMDKVKQCMKEWTDVSGINMEEDYVQRIWQRDVNNYLLVKDNGEVKRKGAWLIDTWEKPGYVMVGALTAFVSAKAVTNYLLYGEDIVKSVVNNNNLVDFVMTCKKGPSYSKVIQRLSDGTEIDLFKCNRVIASKDENLGRLYKIKKYKDKISYTQMPSTPEHCMLLNNDLSTYKLDELKQNIDYMFYIERCADLLDIQWLELKGNQLSNTDKFNYFR